MKTGEANGMAHFCTVQNSAKKLYSSWHYFNIQENVAHQENPTPRTTVAFFSQYQCHPPTPQKPEGLKAFTWPPKSQDPNPIEHPGNALDQALSVKAPLSNPQDPKDPLPMPDTRNCSTPPEVPMGQCCFAYKRDLHSVRQVLIIYPPLRWQIPERVCKAYFKLCKAYSVTCVSGRHHCHYLCLYVNYLVVMSL